MKKTTLIALQLLLLLAANGIFLLLLLEPRLEGRNAQATLFEIYCQDPFLAFVYLASLPIFFGLFQAFKLLGLAAQDRLHSPKSVQAASTLKNCAKMVVGCVVFSLFFMLFADPEDRPAGLLLRLLVGVPAAVITWCAGRLEIILGKSPAATPGNISTF